MELRLDHVVIAVEDLPAASAAYAAMLGREPSWAGGHPALGTRNILFRLDNGYLELLAAEVPARALPLAELVRAAPRGRDERPFAIALAVPDVDQAVATARRRGLEVSDAADGEGVEGARGRRRTWRSAVVDPASVRGLQLLLLTHTSPADALPPAHARGAAPAVAAAFDHLVVFTQDLEASLALWTTRLALRVAWRKDFPERRTRNVGLDLGGVVLELIQRADREPSERGDVLWGVAYRVGDADAAVARLRAGGTEASDVRPGLAAGTRVANVRWQRTPTLLIASG
jgi:catechol 2,3-dioxygenase-like lactoylglutathione lyase family enzyme